jgi:hypothetical protein
MASLDHLVRANEDGLGDHQPERLGSFEVEDKLELGRLFHGIYLKLTK